MKIENNAAQLGGLNATDPVQSSKTGAQGAHRHHHSQDRVDLSAFAQPFASDNAKIAQLKAAYEAGTYKISPEKIAANMISDALAI